ncbi:MocR-like transcription factor YczR [Actinokineospora spheciospongiae]|uniref:MocR-like transcription factor YczR n=1 Tax=Actinokineospora spheciospongiae TaxID=909613 RepID=UPI000D9212B9|nr:GntR family transcriptional regulator [Actinokineospora spheciospongiae]
MDTPTGRISARRLVLLLGQWRAAGSRQGSAGLAAGIRRLVLEGELPPGTTLPAERELAAALGVSRTLVAAAWEQLRADGFLRSRRGSGTWTAQPNTPTAPTALTEQPLDLARAAPAALPDILAAFDRVRDRFAVELGGHGYHEVGHPLLRARLAERFTARGLPTDPDQVLVTNGSHHALALALRALTGPGDRVLVEQPTYPNAIDAIRAAHAVPVPVPMPEAGWDLAGLAATTRQAAPRLAYLVVDFHNPTGRRLDVPGRERLAAVLRRTRTPTVVDETLVELDLDGDPADGPPPMAVFAPNQVITVGSASKSHWGGLRLGWVRAPAEVVHRLVAARYAFDLGSPVFEQLVLAELYADPEPLLAARRAQIRTQRGALVDALREHCPSWGFEVPAGGQSLWCALPAPISTRIAVEAQRVGVRVAPGSRFGVHGGLERWLRLPYTLAPPALVEAVRRLAVVAGEVGGETAPGAGAGLVPVA